MNIAILLYAIALGIALFTLLAMIGAKLMRAYEEHRQRREQDISERRMFETLTSGENSAPLNPR